MAIHYKYNQQNDALYGTIEGQITIEELSLALEEITTSEEFTSNVRTLWDLRKLDFTSIDSSFGEALISMRKNNPTRGAARISILAAEDLSYGMSRMYEMLSFDMPQTIMVSSK